MTTDEFLARIQQLDEGTLRRHDVSQSTVKRLSTFTGHAVKPGRHFTQHAKWIVDSVVSLLLALDPSASPQDDPVAKSARALSEHFFALSAHRSLLKSWKGKLQPEQLAHLQQSTWDRALVLTLADEYGLPNIRELVGRALRERAELPALHDSGRRKGAIIMQSAPFNVEVEEYGGLPLGGRLVRAILSSFTNDMAELPDLKREVFAQRALDRLKHSTSDDFVDVIIGLFATPSRVDEAVDFVLLDGLFSPLAVLYRRDGWRQEPSRAPTWSEILAGGRPRREPDREPGDRQRLRALVLEQESGHSLLDGVLMYDRRQTLSGDSARTGHGPTAVELNAYGKLVVEDTSEAAPAIDPSDDANTRGQLPPHFARRVIRQLEDHPRTVFVAGWSICEMVLAANAKSSAPLTDLSLLKHDELRTPFYPLGVAVRRSSRLKDRIVQSLLLDVYGAALPVTVDILVRMFRYFYVREWTFPSWARPVDGSREDAHVWKTSPDDYPAPAAFISALDSFRKALEITDPDAPWSEYAIRLASLRQDAGDREVGLRLSKELSRCFSAFPRRFRCELIDRPGVAQRIWSLVLERFLEGWTEQGTIRPPNHGRGPEETELLVRLGGAELDVIGLSGVGQEGKGDDSSRGLDRLTPEQRLDAWCLIRMLNDFAVRPRY